MVRPPVAGIGFTDWDCPCADGCAAAGVYFGQLLGMADHLSFTLGRAGYRIHKIVPYGPVHETLQYLIRYHRVFP